MTESSLPGLPGRRINDAIPTVRRLLLDTADGYEVVLSEWEDGSIHGQLTGVNRKTHRTEITVELEDTPRVTRWWVDQLKVNSILGHIQPPKIQVWRGDSRPQIEHISAGSAIRERYFDPALLIFKDYSEAENVIARREGVDVVVEQVIVRGTGREVPMTGEIQANDHARTKRKRLLDPGRPAIEE